jgi:hypothetical protein
MSRNDYYALKNFVMANHLLENDLDNIEKEYAVDLHRGHTGVVSQDEHYYPQIERSIRAEASRMAKHYEVFYSLEKTIRALVADTITAEDGADWWDSSTRVPAKIRTDIESRRQREIDAGMTLRSDDLLDFSTFGELAEIIKANWDIFGGMFSSVKAVEHVMSRLNTLRGPIAHCSELAEDEVVRLQLSVRDWFRLMG